MRQSGSKDDKRWQRGAGLCLDCSGTGTRLRAGAIIVIQSALEPGQSHRTHLEALERDEGEKLCHRAQNYRVAWSVKEPRTETEK